MDEEDIKKLERTLLNRARTTGADDVVKWLESRAKNRETLNACSKKEKPTKKQKTGITVVEIEFQNYVKDRVDEILATGDFPDISDFMTYAVMYSLAGYERSKKEMLLTKLGDLEKYL